MLGSRLPCGRLSPGLAKADPWFGLLCVIVYIAGFAFSLGPVFWLMISEILPLSHRSKAMAVCTQVAGADRAGGSRAARTGCVTAVPR
jgi:hypothetical protein